MNRNLILGLLAVFLLVIAAIQMLFDYNAENSRRITEVAKKSNYCIFVEIEDNTLYLLQDGKCIKKYPISSGQSSLPSPIGYWKIVEKGDWGEGFGGRWMGLNVPWGA